MTIQTIISTISGDNRVIFYSKLIQNNHNQIHNHYKNERIHCNIHNNNLINIKLYNDCYNAIYDQYEVEITTI